MSSSMKFLLELLQTVTLRVFLRISLGGPPWSPVNSFISSSTSYIFQELVQEFIQEFFQRFFSMTYSEYSFMRASSNFFRCFSGNSLMISEKCLRDFLHEFLNLSLHKSVLIFFRNSFKNNLKVSSWNFFRCFRAFLHKS